VECIEKTIGRQDAELTSAEAAKQAPHYTTDYFDVTQIQAPSVVSIARICKLITLKPSNYKCCAKSTMLNWISLSSLASSKAEFRDTDKRQFSCHWGPELKQWACKLQENIAKHQNPLGAAGEKVLHECSIAYALQFYGKDHKDSAELHALLGKCTCNSDSLTSLTS